MCKFKKSLKYKQTSTYSNVFEEVVLDGSVSRMRKCGEMTVWMNSTGTMNGGEVEAATDDERVAAGARVQGREGVADGLHGRGREGGALADVECPKAFFLAE